MSIQTQCSWFYLNSISFNMKQAFGDRNRNPLVFIATQVSYLWPSLGVEMLHYQGSQCQWLSQPPAVHPHLLIPSSPWSLAPRSLSIHWKENHLPREIVGSACSKGVWRARAAQDKGERESWVTKDALPYSLPLVLMFFSLHGLSLQLKDPETSHLLKGLENEEERFLQSKKIQFRNLLSKIESVLQQFWQSQPQWYHSLCFIIICLPERLKWRHQDVQQTVIVSISDQLYLHQGDNSQSLCNDNKAPFPSSQCLSSCTSSPCNTKPISFENFIKTKQE